MKIKEASVTELPVITNLAHRIWPAAYGDILSQDQLAYMLELIYSEKALRQQIEEGQNFLLLYDETEPVGFAGYTYHDDKKAKLNKIYVLPNLQGKGYGKFLLNAVIDKIKNAGSLTLILNVNRHNNARVFYEKQGFVVIDEEDIDIGQGYFMNDYIMEKSLT